MITSIYALGKVFGGVLLLVGYLFCTVFYFAICTLFWVNRKKGGMTAVVVAFLVAELICDFAWFLIFFPNFVYRGGHPLGALAVMALWPFCLLIAGAAATEINGNGGIQRPKRAWLTLAGMAAAIGIFVGAYYWSLGPMAGTGITYIGTVTDHAMEAGRPYVTIDLGNGRYVSPWRDRHSDFPSFSIGDRVELTCATERWTGELIVVEIEVLE